MAAIGVAEAKRRFSELLDRVAEGKRIVVERRGRPAVALVPPQEAGALEDVPELDELLGDVARARDGARDRPSPDLGDRAR